MTAHSNALAESTIGLYKSELVATGGPFRGLADLEMATLGWVDWWNQRRLHGAIGMIPPAEAEAHHAKERPAGGSPAPAAVAA